MSPTSLSGLSRWTVDPIVSATSRLLPVRHRDLATMLKISTNEEEQAGGRVLAWWDGKGAARVLTIDGNAVLMELAPRNRSLATMAHNDQDDKATRIICDVIAELHQARASDPPPDLIPLSLWFRELEPAAMRYGGPLVPSAAFARALLANPQDVRVLHGDIHHENILDFGERGWLAIDPAHRRARLRLRQHFHQSRSQRSDVASGYTPGALPAAVDAGDREERNRTPAPASLDHRMVRVGGGLVHRGWIVTGN